MATRYLVNLNETLGVWRTGRAVLGDGDSNKNGGHQSNPGECDGEVHVLAFMATWPVDLTTDREALWTERAMLS